MALQNRSEGLAILKSIQKERAGKLFENLASLLSGFFVWPNLFHSKVEMMPAFSSVKNFEQFNNSLAEFKYTNEYVQVTEKPFTSK